MYLTPYYRVLVHTEAVPTRVTRRKTFSGTSSIPATFNRLISYVQPTHIEFSHRVSRSVYCQLLPCRRFLTISQISALTYWIRFRPKRKSSHLLSPSRGNVPFSVSLVVFSPVFSRCKPVVKSAYRVKCVFNSTRNRRTVTTLCKPIRNTCIRVDNPNFLLNIIWFTRKTAVVQVLRYSFIRFVNLLLKTVFF